MTMTADALFSDTKAAPAADTPVLRQWRQFKETHPDFLLLFRMGDFYEAFHDDAETLGRVCGVTVTTRSKGDGAPSVTMAGVPFHAVEGYLRKLIAAGHKVAICEEVTGTAAKAKGAAKREVKRLVTPEKLAEDAPPDAAPPTTPLQVKAQRGGLLDALTALSAVIPGRPFKPILACVRLEATADRLLMEATNLEQWVRHAQTTIQVEQRGALLVPLSDLLRVCQEYDDSDTLAIEQQGDWLYVRGESAQRRMPAVAVSEWPSLPQHWPAPLGSVPAAALRRIFTRTAFAAAKEGAMYAYHGWPIYADGKTLRAAAGEGHIFAESTCPCPPELVLPDTGVLVPRDAVAALLKGLEVEGSDEKAEVGIWADDCGAAFTCGDYGLRTNLIEGHFPPYPQVMAEPREFSAAANAVAMHATIRRAVLGLEEHANGLRLTFGKSGLTAVADDTPDAAEARLPLKWTGPDGFAVGFSPKFLLPALDAIRDDPDAQLHFAHPRKPALLTAPFFRCVLCPFALRKE